MARRLHYHSATAAGPTNPAFAKRDPFRRCTVADTIRGTLAEAGNAVAETATKVGNRIGEKAEEVKDWAKEKANKSQNRADEADQKACNSNEVAREDAKAKSGNCGCS